MKTQRSTILLACAAIAIAAVFTGCTKGTFGYGGKAVTFATTSSGSLATKTEYGVDKTEDGITKQALNWKSGDVITISSPEALVQNSTDQHASNYKVTVTSTGVPSKGTVSNESANGLMWPEDETKSYTFHSVYPKVKTNGSYPTLDPTDGKVTAEIPAVQTLATTTTTKTVGTGDDAITYTVYEPDMKYAYMTAAASAKPTDEKVSLSFEPAFTAIEFNVSSKDNDIKLKNIGLYASGTSDKLSGTYSMTAGSALATGVTVSSGIDSVFMSLGDGVTVTKTAGATFTLFMLPKTNGEAISMKFKEDGVGTCVHSLTTKDDGSVVPFEAGHKYRINMLKLPSNRWNFKVIDLTGVAYEWEDVKLDTLDTKNYPEATQFEVEGANNGRYYTRADQTAPVDGRNAKAFRQYWLMKTDTTVVVKFKVMSPIGYDWLVVPSDTTNFTVTSTVDTTGYQKNGLRGPIMTKEGYAATTNVILYIKAKNTQDTTERSLYLKTYAISRDDKIQYSLDSETQLYDMRGYHYFVINNTSIVN